MIEPDAVADLVHEFRFDVGLAYADLVVARRIVLRRSALRVPGGNRLLERILDLRGGDALNQFAKRVMTGELDPYAAADTLIGTLKDS